MLFLFLKWMERRNLKPGAVLLLYGFLYSSWRFFVEFFRGDNPVTGFGLTVFQLVSIPLML